MNLQILNHFIHDMSKNIHTPRTSSLLQKRPEEAAAAATAQEGGHPLSGGDPG